mmetsp:Transcript_20477/g.45564  ORF Transcript_20477/g.45564 Transcript_20477/m.45564 type:complete len:208 (+) Transcript_20477:204-827(+)
MRVNVVARLDPRDLLRAHQLHALQHRLPPALQHAVGEGLWVELLPADVLVQPAQQEHRLVLTEGCGRGQGVVHALGLVAGGRYEREQVGRLGSLLALRALHPLPLVLVSLLAPVLALHCLFPLQRAQAPLLLLALGLQLPQLRNDALLEVLHWLLVRPHEPVLVRVVPHKGVVGQQTAVRAAADRRAESLPLLVEELHLACEGDGRV